MARIPTVSGSAVPAPVGGAGGFSPALARPAGQMRGGGEIRGARVSGDRRQAVTRSADALNARYRGAQEVAGALANVGGAMVNFAAKKQEMVNKGILAQEETIRLQTAGEIEKYMQANQDKPETWAEFNDSTWKSYEAGRADRQNKAGWSPSVKGADSLQYQDYRARTAIQFQAEENRAVIRQANARIESNATAKLAAGDVVGFEMEMSMLNVFPEQKEEKYRQISNAVLYQKYDRQMSDIAEMPAAERRKGFAAIEASLAGKDQDGNPTAGTIKGLDGKTIGGLSEAARTDLIRAARARKQAAVNEMQRETVRLFNVLESTGSPDEFNLQSKAALSGGRIDAELWVGVDEETGGYTFKGSAVGDYSSTMQTADEEAGPTLTRMDARAQAARKAEYEKRQALEMQVRGQMQKQQDTAQGMVDAAQGGKLTVEAVNRRVKSGEISEAQGQQLRSIVDRIAKQDLTLGNKLVLSLGARDAQGRPLRDVRGAITDYRVAAEAAKSDIASIAAAGAKKLDSVTSLEKQTWLASVNALPISIEAKTRLLRDYLAAYEVDLVGFDQKDGKTVKLGKRQLTGAEVAARRKIAEAWKYAPGLGEPWSGDLLLKHERALTDYFTSDEFEDNESSYKVAGQMAADFAQEVADTSAQRLLEMSIPSGIPVR